MPNANNGTGELKSVVLDGQQSSRPVYDLAERTAQFGEAIIRLGKALPRNVVTIPLINQITKSGTSVGANYCEADESVSRKEFRLKICTCKKESRETKFWLRMIATAEPPFADQARSLWKEANELHLIFCAIYRKISTRQK